MRWTIFFLTLAIGWYIHESVPKNFSEPWKLRAFLATIRASMDVIWTLEQCGLLSHVDTINSLLTFREKNTTTYDSGTIVETTIEGVSVRMYKPSGVQNNLPAMIFYHGGGWALSNPRLYDSMIIPIASHTKMLIISVDYRKPPRHIYPVALDDCLAVTIHVLRHPRKYGIDPTRVAVGGDSAGGNLAAALTLKLRNIRFNPMPKLQVLIYPVLQPIDYSLPSKIQNAKGPLLSNYWLAYYYELYARGIIHYASYSSRNYHTTPEIKEMISNTYINHNDIDMNYHYTPYTKPKKNFGEAAIWDELKSVYLDPYFAPLLADDFSGLPETYIYTPYYDILRDDGILYAKRLEEADVPVTHVLGTSDFHGICSYTSEFQKEGYECIQHIIDFLERL